MPSDVVDGAEYVSERVAEAPAAGEPGGPAAWGMWKLPASVPPMVRPVMFKADEPWLVIVSFDARLVWPLTALKTSAPRLTSMLVPPAAVTVAGPPVGPLSARSIGSASVREPSAAK